MATVLVTGGAGFIGSHMTAELLRRGHAVRVIDDFSTGSRENLSAVGGEVELVEGHIRSYERTHAATRGVDCVIHLAALPSVPRSISDCVPETPGAGHCPLVTRGGVGSA